MSGGSKSGTFVRNLHESGLFQELFPDFQVFFKDFLTHFSVPPNRGQSRTGPENDNEGGRTQIVRGWEGVKIDQKFLKNT